MPKNLIRGREIVLYGTVGYDWCDEGFTAMDVIAALMELGSDTDVVVRINSGGGFAFEGLAIYSALAAHKGKVTCVVDAIAGSAASIIAMAGDEVVMRLGAMMMIHDPATITWGDAEDHRCSVSFLDKLGVSLAAIYAARTGKSAEECRALMVAETWLTAEDAVTGGFADRIGLAAAADEPVGLPDPGESDGEDDGEEGAAPMGDPTAFDYRVYMHAPEALRAVASAKGWTNRRPLAAIAVVPGEIDADVDDPTPVAKAVVPPVPPPPTPHPSATAEALAAEASARAAAAAASAATVAAEIATACAEAGEPMLAAPLIRAGATAEMVAAKLAEAKDIRAAVATARRTTPEIDASTADRAIAAGSSLDAVRADLFARITAADAAAPATISAHQPGGGGGAPAKPRAGLDATRIYARMNGRSTAA